MSRPETILAPVPEPVAPSWGAAVIAPDAEQGLPVRTFALNNQALYWLVQCHGGAGASTLASLVHESADGGQAWPGRDDESPYVVLVARESIEGLRSMHTALRQYLTENAPDHVQLLGLALVAASPARKPAKAIQRYRELVEELAPVPVYDIGWHEYLLSTDRTNLPVTSLDGPETPPRKWSPDTSVPPEVDRMGRSAGMTVLTAHQN